VSITVGSRVGPYEVLSTLGEGGMGVVYRAHDSRLGRDVAIKVSSERFSERFEREARAVAALNHPNICTLYDVGPDYLVMELVEGDTLGDVLARRPRSSPGLPLDEVLRIARQITLALEAAHDKGVVHRDLKPGNIKITPDGTVKVLDFGLAKIEALAPDGSSGSEPDRLTHSPTIGVTQVGVIMGTAAYMAPEQARGKAVDKRADIWAFGAVLFEMVTGRRPFDGDDVATILAAVIQSEPRWDGVPPQVQRLIGKCLEKDPRRRLRDIGDAWELVDDGPQSMRAKTRSGIAGWIAAGAFALVAALALWAPWRNTSPPSDRPLVRLEVDLGSDVALAPLLAPTPSTVAISPDGTRLVYLASVAGRPSRLVTRRLDQSTAMELPGTEGAVDPFFSSDGRWVGFFNGNKVSKVSVDGGAVVPVVAVGIFAGAQWIDDSTMIVGSGLTAGVLRVPADGGEAKTLVELGEGELFHGTPQMLPGGRAVLVTVYGTPPSVDRASIDVVSLVDHRHKTIARGGTGARYLSSGHIVYTNRNTMFALPFNVDTLEPLGSAVPILNDVAYDPAAGLPQFDVARDGTLVYRRGSGGRTMASVQWIDPSGRSETLYPKPSEHVSPPRISPDRTRVAMVIKEGAGQDVWIYDTRRDAPARLTFGDAAYVSPIWSRDGKFVVFGSIGGGVFWARADGGGRPELLIQSTSKNIAFPTSFSSDGTRLAYYEVVGIPQIWTVSVEYGNGLKAGKPERFLVSQSADILPMFSPDGRWIAYQSNESGTDEVFVRPFPPAAGKGGRWQISNSGGIAPQWSPNGREIVYRAGNQIMSVGYTANGDAFLAEKPRVWMSKLAAGAMFDLAPDGKRIAALVPTVLTDATQAEHTVVFLQNFFDELRRRAPVRK